MPSPVALASKEEEATRAWVTAHHEVVKLVKDCFGDRFSNNEIFDRLKISRRTGYRALGNDERIGKAPGRKPKILESTIKDMIDYIENGGCNDVGNVWKHLAEKFAPDCNPKTVQDAVKKSGFKNHKNTVKLEPLLAEHASEDHQDAEEDDPTQDIEIISQEPAPQQIPQPQPQQQLQQLQIQPQQQQNIIPQQQQNIIPQQQQNVIDPVFHQTSLMDILYAHVQNMPDAHIRYTLWEICRNSDEAAQMAASILNIHAFQPSGMPHAQMNAQQMMQMPQTLNGQADASQQGRRPRLAICRRCNQQYDRAENTMSNRSCLYHKGGLTLVAGLNNQPYMPMTNTITTNITGSLQKIFPEGANNIEQSPEAYIWSCCAGNGTVRGCQRAMHTTKPKRKYGKKRTADDAGLDGNEGGDGEGDDSGPDDDNTSTMAAVADAAGAQLGVDDDANIDASLRDMHPGDMNMQQLSMQMAAQMAAPPALMGHLNHHQHHQLHHHHQHHHMMGEHSGIGMAMGAVEAMRQQQQQQHVQQHVEQDDFVAQGMPPEMQGLLAASLVSGPG